MSEPTPFTVDAANKRLPYVRAIVRDIVALAGDLQQREERLDEIRQLHELNSGESPHSEEFEQMEEAVEQDFARFNELEQELLLVGVNVVDRNTGLVEILARMDDRIIWLNWQPDEMEFMFWRSAEDDPMIRRPLLESVGEAHEFFSDAADTDC